MTSPISPEWVGFNTFAPATQTKLLELLGRLKEENVNELTILVMGKCGVGKSSTVNSIIGERVVTINPFQASTIPVILVENSGRCNKNENEEKVIPNGIAWIPNLLQSITEVAISDYKSINVDKKLIERPNPNQRGKIFIPLIISLQYFFVIKPMERAIKNGIARESEPS